MHEVFVELGHRIITPYYKPVWRSVLNSFGLLLRVMAEYLTEETQPVLPIMLHFFIFTVFRDKIKKIVAIRILYHVLVKFSSNFRVVVLKKIENGDFLRLKIRGLCFHPYTRVKTQFTKKVSGESIRFTQILVRVLRLKDAVNAQHSYQCQKMNRISRQAN